MSTSKTGRVKQGLFTGLSHGLCHHVISLICMFIEAAVAQCHPNTGDEPGKKSYRGDQTWDIPDAQPVSAAC